MDRLPGIVTSSLPSWANVTQSQAAHRAQRSAELDAFRYALRARVAAECDRADSRAVADVMRAALDEEFALLEYGLQRAGASAAKVELVARKVEMLAATNNRRIERRFPG